MAAKLTGVVRALSIAQRFSASARLCVTKGQLRVVSGTVRLDHKKKNTHCNEGVMDRGVIIGGVLISLSLAAAILLLELRTEEPVRKCPPARTAAGKVHPANGAPPAADCVR